VKRRHDHQRLARAVLETPLAAELLLHDALLAHANRLLAIAVGKRERHGLARRHADERRRQHQERKTPVQ
jgi:hypothetical protein